MQSIVNVTARVSVPSLGTSGAVVDVGGKVVKPFGKSADIGVRPPSW